MGFLVNPDDERIVAPHAFALKCMSCDWRPEDDVTMGVVKAHFETEHEDIPIGLELIIVCPRCDASMTLLATVGRADHFECKPCHRSKIVKRRS